MTVEEKLAKAEKLAQKAQDYIDIQNLMAAHLACYRAQKQYYEIENYWVKHRDDIAYGNVLGRKAVMSFYCDGNARMRKEKLKLVHEHYPEVEICPENEGVGDMVAKGAANPYVIIAEDGMSAKGLWFSPGMCVEVGPDCRPKANYIQEKVGIDFLKEPEGWKIFRLNLYLDFMTNLPTELFEEHEHKERTFSFPTKGEHREEKPPKREPPYSVKKPAAFQPEIPQPYETWDDSMAFPPEQ